MPKFKEIIIQYVNVFDNTYVDLSGNTQPVQPLDIYLVPNEDLSHDRYVVDNTGVISKQSNGSQANYLRASGTDPDQQIAGSFRTQTASFHVYRDGYPYDSQFTLSPGDIELSSRVIMEDPKNPINRILVREDGIRFTTKNFICDSIPNVQGDTSYTRQLVQKNDGTVGYEPKTTIPQIFSVFSSILERNTEQDYVIFDIDFQYLKAPDWGNKPVVTVDTNNTYVTGSNGSAGVRSSDVTYSVIFGGGYGNAVTNMKIHLKIKRVSIHLANVYTYNTFGFSISFNVDGIEVNKLCSVRPDPLLPV
ncbi:MAG: hypothetical protein DI622_14240 [Chryseobacterium sp.]|uniref:hypothetical protein n=1 Tax=Chryseobacterium sp. Y16C TaxID=2920939 RepID=UPI000DB1A30A|nr:hypothetical protein [Chryseobacterium sp. Y16C]PZU13417.1 MAG: hypothetical protein DI622_14240 [Chryseobacterium sp.]UMQ43421.1 hypothetical protein MKS83_06910 [Chryseobacterium sp. Y16C]